MFLTSEDMVELTGYRRPSSQVKWLLDRGYRFDIRADGRPRVLKSYLENRLGECKVERQVEPNFDFLSKTV